MDLRICPPPGRDQEAKTVGRGPGPGNGKTSGRGTRAAERAPAATRRPATKAAKCRCNGVCRSAASATLSAGSTAVVNLKELDARFESRAVVDLSRGRSGWSRGQESRCWDG